eukprot:4319142-Prymnesium_polylepis.1
MPPMPPMPPIPPGGPSEMDAALEGRREIAHEEARDGRREGRSRLRRAEAVSYTHLTLPTICSV